MTKEDILHHFQDINFYYNDCMMYDDLSRMLDELIAENKGEWIDEGFYADGHSQHAYRCSECGEHYIGYVGEFKYCPNCGADMRGE